MMKKSYVAITLAFAAISFAACGNSGTASSTSASTTAAGESTSAASTNTSETTSSVPRAADAKVLKCGTKMPVDSIEGQSFQHFADLVAEKTNGEVVVDIYPSEQLGDTTTEMDNLQLGTQDLYIEGIALWARYDSIFDYGNIPFLFTNYDEYREKTLGEITEKEQEVLLNNGQRMLTTERNWIRGPYRVLVSTEPFTVDSVKGLRIRSFDSATYGEAWKRLGANPLTLAWSDCYMGLKQGTVAAVASPLSLVYDMKFTEVAPYVTNISEFPQEIGVVISEKTYQSLTEDQQKAMEDAANEAAEWGNQLLDESSADLMQKMTDENNAQFSEIDTTPLKEQLTDWYKELESEGTIPEGILE
jgi:TRAP-type C4-dicarboxylate transport system substrate-binding protein